MNKIIVKACRIVCAGALVVVVSIAALPHAQAAELPVEEVQITGEQLAETLSENISEAIMETFADEQLITPYEYTPYGDLTILTGFTADELEFILAGSGLEGLGSFYAEKEQTHGVNALFLISVAQLESGFGKSGLAKNSNNLGGLKNGSGGYMKFASKQECVEYQVTLLRDNYLCENGKYYAGKTTKGVSKKYCEGSESWHTQVEGLMKRNYNKIVGMRAEAVAVQEAEAVAA